MPKQNETSPSGLSSKHPESWPALIAWFFTKPSFLLITLGLVSTYAIGITLAYNNVGFVDFLNYLRPTHLPSEPLPKHEKKLPTGKPDDYSGYYDYRSTPANPESGLLQAEDGKSCHQFIGKTKIIRDPKTDAYSIKAERFFCVVIKEGRVELERLKKVEWGAEKDDVFFPQTPDEGLIFLLHTGRNPPNIGFVKAKIDSETRLEDGKASMIKGDMHYLLRPLNNKNNVTEHRWIRAEITFRRKANYDEAIYYAQKEIIEEWFESKSLLREYR